MTYNIELTVECGHNYETYQYDGGCFDYGITRLFDILYYNWHELESAAKDIVRTDFKYSDIDNVVIDIYKSGTEEVLEHKQLFLEDLL